MYLAPVIIGVVIVFLVVSGLYIVPQQQVAIIERLGKFHKVSDAGIHVRIPLIDIVRAKPSLRVLQLDNIISTKTKDNVFVQAKTSLQYRVNPQDVKTAYYELTSPGQQIQAYIEDALRSAVPSLTLDEAFERKDDIAQSVQTTVAEEMGRFGFVILKTLITELEPDEKVRASMNEINAAQSLRLATGKL